ncbi:peptidoglycan-binding domain-containing protein [Cellulomonas endometrii]|uniref:peptidoglycan-binding domain-containing protein n=1 Tax=Cellulomonas endometrii TaxID=3036301 RepID=UPI0024AE4FF1|nr:peptidoglycan-binding domain-containing protein [Cellulomonas endometrii]
MARARDRRYGSWIVVWALTCTLIAAAAATVVVLRNSSSPLASDAPVEAVVAQVAVQTRTESAVVGLAARRVDGPQAVFAVSGTVTSLPITPGSVLEPGAVLATVDDLPIVAMSGAAPPHRALAPGAEGEDVTRLQTFLANTGYLRAPADGKYGASTARAVKAWNVAHGRRGDTFDPAAVVWIGADRFEVASVAVKVGDVVTPGQAIALGPALLEGVAVDEPSTALEPGSYVIRVGEVSVPYTAGAGVVTDPEAAAALIRALGSDEGAGELTSAEPAEVTVVPASAVVTDSSGRTCVYPDATAPAVVIQPVGSAAGSIYLPPDAPVTQVLVNPAQTRGDLTCSS